MFWAKRGSSEGIFIVPRLGGSPRHLPMLESNLLCWSPDGSQIAGSALPLRRIRLINKSTGDTTAIRVSGDFVFMRELDWTPAGNRLLFMTTKQHRTIIWTIKSDGTQQQRVAEDSIPVYSPRWSANGRAIYYLRFNGQTKDLMKVRISPKTGKARTAAYVLQTGLQPGEFFTLTKDNKRLLYLRASRHSNLWRVSLAGEGRAQSVEIHKLTTGTSSLHRPRLSPDGESVAFSTGDQPYSNIFVIPFAGGAVRQLTFLDNQNINPVWSPDGKEIAFGSIHRGNPKIWRIAATGDTPRPFERTIASTVFHLTWAPGPEILYPQIGNRNFHFLNPRTEEERPLVANDAVGRMFYPRYSPDAKKMAVYWNRVYPTNLQGLWVISLRDSSQTRLLRGRVHPLEWSTDGKWIYAWNTDVRPLAILKVAVDGSQAQTVVTLPFENIDSLGGISITPDGKRIVCASLEVQSEVWLMENFDPEE
jgi:Tol biopolymer transport system component